MKLFKKTFSVLLCAFLAMQTTTAFAASKTVEEQNNIAYVYPITPNNKEEWSNLVTVQEKYDACQIPEELLKSMSTEALTETVANYPMSVNLYAFNTLDQGYESVKSNFNGLEELERRAFIEPQTVLENMEDEVQELSYSTKTRNASNNLNYYFITRIKQCIENRTNYKVEKSTIQPRYSSTYVKTPKGSKVTAYKDFTWSDIDRSKSECQAYHDAVKSTYPSVTVISGISPKYNCHSYAWYSTSTSNSYWINDPSKYVSDGSYIKASIYKLNSKILYKNGDQIIHSGIISGVSEKHLTYVTSKWGALGVYKHLYFDCPYGNASVSSYVKSA